jgi:hypothetical protein
MAAAVKMFANVEVFEKLQNMGKNMLADVEGTYTRHREQPQHTYVFVLAPARVDLKCS